VGGGVSADQFESAKGAECNSLGPTPQVGNQNSCIDVPAQRETLLVITTEPGQRAISAKGAECNSLGHRPRLGTKLISER